MISEINILNQKISYYYKNDNHKYTILFIHGFASSKSLVKYLEKYENRNYNIIAFDCPGFGASKTEKPQTIEDYQNITKEFIDKLVPENTIIIGHSLGSLSAVSIIDNPKIMKIILLSSINPWQTPKNYKDIIKMLIPSNIADAESSLKHIAYSMKRYGRAFNSIAKFFLKAAPKNRKLFYKLLSEQSLNKAYLTKYIQPLFLAQKGNLIFIHGKNDIMIPIDGMQELANNLNAPLITMAKTGHSPIFEKPEIVNDYLVHYFNLFKTTETK